MMLPITSRLLRRPASRRRASTWATLLLPCLLSLGACKPKGETCKPEDHPFTNVRVAVQPTDDINPDLQGTPRATSLRIYQLEGGRSLDMPLDFDQVWQDAKSAFGDELLKEEELTIYPGKAHVFELEPEDETTHFVAAAIFRESVGNAWYAEWEVPKFHGDSVCIAEKKKQAYEDPCFLIFMEGSQIDGGHEPPPGMDVNVFEIVCPPPPLTVKPAPELDPKQKKKEERETKRKKRREKAEGKAEDAQDKGADAQEGSDKAQGASDKADGASKTVSDPGSAAPEAPTAPGKG